MTVKFPYRVTKLSRLWKQKGRKYGYVIYDGPLFQNSLYLSGPGTLPFTLNGETGRYVLELGKLKWRSINTPDPILSAPEFKLK